MTTNFFKVSKSNVSNSKARNSKILNRRPNLSIIRLASVSAALLLATNIATAKEYTYSKVAKTHPSAKLSKKLVENAKMQGECLVGLKELNYRKKEKFDPVAEWSSYRSISLLEQYSPCEVLIMMEVAQKKIKQE